jgi:biotin synthase
VRNLGRLVEAALAQSRRGERHGDQRIDAVRGCGDLRGDRERERAPELTRAAILERVDVRRERRHIVERRAYAIDQPSARQRAARDRPRQSAGSTRIRDAFERTHATAAKPAVRVASTGGAQLAEDSFEPHCRKPQSGREVDSLFGRSDTVPSTTRPGERAMSALQQQTQHEAARAPQVTGEPRHDWTLEQVEALYALPFNDLVYAAQWVHRQHFDPNAVQVSTLLSIKTGACPEDCAYCPQSIRFETGVSTHDLMPLDEVLAAARRAKEAGATRFCMGASYRGPKDKQLEPILEMVSAVKALGLETCATLGLLRPGQAEQLAAAGLDYYNHNLDSSADFYTKIIGTRTYADRLETLARVRGAGVKVCCGGILGMGETRRDRAELLRTLACLDPQPESVPINDLVPVPGTPLEGAEPLDPFEFVRSIAVARILLPRSHVRLSAGRTEFSDELQALCFIAGANSIFYGEKLLTTGNPDCEADQRLFERLGVTPEPASP